MFNVLTQNKDRLFWTLQIAGWTAFGFLHYLLVGEMNDRSGDYALPALMYAGGGIVVTTGLRHVYRAVWRMKPAWILIIGSLASLLASIIFTASMG